MPFTLSELIGGLGNQLFILSSVYALSRQYNTRFTYIKQTKPIISIVGTIIPNYMDTIFSEFLKCEYYINTIFDYTSYTSILELNMQQFIVYTLPETIDMNTTIVQLKGLPMHYLMFCDYLYSISQMLYKTKVLYIPESVKLPHIRKIGIMFRTFAEENSNQWMVVDAYYEKAIQYMLKQRSSIYTIEFHIFTDTKGVTESIVQPILDTMNINIPCKEYVGKRDNKTDVEHFFTMFDLDDFILCNSTYHYWPALLSTYSNNKIVTYPTSTKDGNQIDWFEHIVHPTWIKL